MPRPGRGRAPDRGRAWRPAPVGARAFCHLFDFTERGSEPGFLRQPFHRQGLLGNLVQCWTREGGLDNVPTPAVSAEVAGFLQFAQLGARAPRSVPQERNKVFSKFRFAEKQHDHRFPLRLAPVTASNPGQHKLCGRGIGFSFGLCYRLHQSSIFSSLARAGSGGGSTAPFSKTCLILSAVSPQARKSSSSVMHGLLTYAGSGSGIAKPERRGPRQGNLNRANSRRRLRWRASFCSGGVFTWPPPNHALARRAR